MLFLILLAPILFNLTGLIDTFLTTKFKNHESDGILEDGTATLMIIWGVIALLVSLFIFPFFHTELFSIWSRSIFFLFVCGVFYGLAAYPYFKALRAERIENIIPILQTIPLFTYILAFFILDEKLGLSQVLIIFAIVVTTILFGRDYHSKTMNRKGVFLTVVSSLCYAVSYIFFKMWGGESTNIWISFFREHLGVAIVCLLWWLKSRVFSTTRLYFKTNGRKFSILNLWNEVFYIVGVMIVNFLTLLYPVAVVSTLSNGIQPLLWFLMTYLAFKLYPRLFERNYTKQDLILKIWLCILACGLLAWFFHLTS